jgi:hypothetical protein
MEKHPEPVSGAMTRITRGPDERGFARPVNKIEHSRSRADAIDLDRNLVCSHSNGRCIHHNIGI